MNKYYRNNGSAKITIKAPAKINLALEIVGKREDGYHLIETVFQAIDLYDELSFSPLERGISLTSDKGDLACGKENIIYKAASAILDFEGEKRGIKIHLKKRIPIGAGLGGGSSDAAATLKGVIKLYNMNIPRKDLNKIASCLGADVPFFLDGPTAYGHGTGTIIEKSPSIPQCWVLIVKPNFSISTAWAYSEYKFRLTNTSNKIKILRLALESSNIRRICDALFNDLESVCFVKFPILHNIKDRLIHSGASGALMSGSGSAVFGIFHQLGLANKTKEDFEKAIGKENEIFLCRTIE